MIDFEVSGLIELEADLAHEVANIEPATGRAVVAQAVATAARMRANIARRTGATAATITNDRAPSNDSDGVAAEAGPTSPVARYLEYGTSKMAPRPFADQSTNVDGLERAVGDAVDL